MSYYREISKDEFYRCGGFSNHRLFRVEKSGTWKYFEYTN